MFHVFVDGDDAARFGNNRIGYAGRRRHHVQQMEAIGKRRDTGRWVYIIIHLIID